MRQKTVSFAGALVAMLTIAISSAAIASSPNFGKGMAAYKHGDYATAIAQWRPLSKQGNASAQFNLGTMYRYGKGVLPDDVKAAKWIRKAAKQGLAKAQYTLGMMYFSGTGVSQDYAQAASWYQKAAKQGDAKSQFALGAMYDDGLGMAVDDTRAIQGI